MNTQVLAELSAVLSDATGSHSELSELLKKWLEKRLKSKTTTLDTLRLVVRSSGEHNLAALLSAASEPCRRTVGKNIDPNNKELPAKSGSGITDHIVALAAGRIAAVPKQIKGPSTPRGGKKSSKGTKLPGDILTNSKY